MLAADTPPAIVAPAPAHGQLIGVIATGPQSDLDRLEVLTKTAGFPCKQLDGPEGHELLVAFPPGSEIKKVDGYLWVLRGGAFSALTFRSAIAPPR